MFEELSAAVPIKSKTKLICAGGAIAYATAPVVGFIPTQLQSTMQAIGMGDQALYTATAVGLTLSAMSWPFFIAKAKELFIPSPEVKQRKERYLRLGTMTFAEKDLFTNVLTTGAIGSGKTSAVIYPALRQICNMYNDETLDSKHPHQKWGGLVLDVKGEFYETLIYFLHRSGRNVLYDIILIRPDADYPIVKLQDPDTGYYWYITAAGGSEAREIDYVVEGSFMADGSKIPSTVFTETAEIRAKYEDHLKSLVFEVTKPLYFVGWREEGGKQVRVNYTDEAAKIHYALDSKGQKIKVDTPKRLKYVLVDHVNNGIRYNICSPHLPPAEVASRLVSIAETLGGGGGGDNQYWTDSAKKLMGFIIHLWRNLNEEEASALEIVRLTTQKTALDDQLRKLEVKITELQEEFLNNPDDPVKMKEKDAKRRFLTDVQKYFTDEWGKLDPKTKGIIVSVVSNLFGPFITDYQLQEVFCKPATISFEDTIQKGKIITLLAGGQYETLAKQLGTSLKMDFQSICKSRTTLTHYNKVRVVMFMADEAQVYVTAGGGNNTGDENFMALSRQSRVINFIATQSDSSIISVIGEKKAPVYFQSFGGRIWLQNTDYTTNQNAARILGKVKKEETKSSGKEFSIDSVFGKESSNSVSTEFKEDERFKIETFSNLNVFDAVIYNKGKKGARDKACKYKGKPDAVGDPNSTDFKERHATLRWFYQGYIENRLHQLDETYKLNHTPITESSADTITPVAAADEVSGNRRVTSEVEAARDFAPDDDVIPVSNPADARGPVTGPLNVNSARPKTVQPLIDTETVLVTGAPGPASTSPLPPEEAMDDENPFAAASHLLGEDDANGIAPERINELERQYGTSKEVGKRMLEFASLIDDAELPMRAEFDPESLLLYNDPTDEQFSSAAAGGIFTYGASDDPFPVELPDEHQRQIAGTSVAVPLTPAAVDDDDFNIVENATGILAPGSEDDRGV